MSRDKQIEETTQYYVLRNKDTGMYFRGKGVNRWGKYFNQATIYRVKGNAEASIREVSWHGEKAEIVPIQIFENDAGYRKASNVAEEIFAEIEKIINEPFAVGFDLGAPLKQALGDYNNGIRKDLLYYVAKLKKKYTEGGE